MKRARAVIAGLAALIAAGSAMTATVAPLPPFATAYTPTTVDERGLWQQADEHERMLRDSPAVIRDPALNAYVRGVLCRAVGSERCAAVRLYIERVPAFNATMSPNGMMEVWSGLLLRVRNEAELAAVLGHEFGHFELRHSLNGFKRARTLSDAMIWAAILLPQMQTTIVGLHYAYQRGDETAADLMGMRFLKAARYRPSAAPAVWERMMAEEDERALGRKRTATHRYAAGFFATHPTELSRAIYLRKAAGTEAEAEDGDDNAAAYRAALGPWRAQFLVDQIKLNDFGGSEYLLQGLAGKDWPPDLLLARAELYRERGHPRDLVSAASFYRQAIDGGCTEAAAWRGLGLALIRGGQTEPGRAALRTYLTKVPDASDKAALAMLIGEETAQ